MSNTREKLIDIIEYFADFLDWDMKEDIVDRIIESLATDNNVGHKWIPVTERLPKSIANKVIVRCKNDYIGFGHYQNYKGDKTWYNLENDRPFTDWDIEDCESYEVTHWMPLPEPPKGEQI